MRKMMLAAMMTVLAVSACTKKKELVSDVDSTSYIAKTDLVGKTFHLTRGIEEADETNVVDAVPGFSEDFGLVQARITEDELQLVSVFNPRGKPETMTILASFPIRDQFDIKRATNDFGDQSNHIVEDRKKPWQDRQYVRIDWSNPSNTMSKIVPSGWGVGEENTVVLEPGSVDKQGQISWKVETSVATPWTGGARVMYRTHLLPVKKSDFTPVSYTLEDFERFGYFFTQQNWEDSQKGVLDKNVKRFAEVFNVCESEVGASCSRNKIVWVVSKGFPEMYKDVTRQVVREWNETFQQALGRTDDVVVLDESVQADISDPTKNVIAYYPSKTSIGLLGVAQTVTDPRTGEVVAARSTIFEDGIQGTLGWVDDTIELLASENPIADIVKTDALKGTPTKFKSPFTDGKIADHLKLMRGALGMNKIKTQQGLAKNPIAIVNESRKTFNASADKSTIRMANLAAKAPSLFAVQDLTNFQAPFDEKEKTNLKATNAEAPFLGGMEKLIFGFEKVREDKRRVMEFAEKGVHGAELVEDAAARYLMKLLKTQTPQQMKSQKDKIKEEIAKQTFYTTLLHEMGHNFGLRHNFAGSADSNNYSPEYYQLKAKMDAGDKSITEDDLLPYAFSSIMDYGGDFYSQVGGLGPYDKAAIKYAYNRGANRDEVAVRKVGGKTVGYKFCTDHQVDEEITCRRFDKGKNVSEITMNNINRFNVNWPLSHFRRDRYYFGRNMGAQMGRMLMNTMVPVRQVMDEFIYSFIAGQQPQEKLSAAEKAKAPAGTTEGLCEMKFVHKSVVAGEIANICSPLAMEKAGVDPTDLETLYSALINPATGGLYKQPSEYTQYGMADLLFANLAAQEFFQSVLGATEPGTYLALPPQQRGAPFNLIRLDQDQPTDEDKLKAFAEENGIPNPDGFVKQAKNFVTDVKIGGSGRPFSSSIKTVAGFSRTEAIGSFWDKYAAILALGFRDIGVMKYSEKSMNGNAYAFPQSKKFATALFDKLITGNPGITLIPVELRLKGEDGKPLVVPGAAQASLNTDTQALSTFVGFGLLASDTDTSFIDKLRICNTNEGQCSQGVGGEVVEFRSAGGGDVFRAAQTANTDSIAFSLVKDAKGVSDEREKWVDIGKKSGEAQADNLLKLDAAGELRERMDANLARIPELKAVRDGITSLDPRAQTAWNMMVLLTQNIDKAPLFFSLDLAQKIGGAFQAASGMVDAQLEAMGDKGICAPQPQEGGEEPGDGVPALIADTPEMRAMTAARVIGNAGNMSVVLANMAPPPAPPAPGNAGNVTPTNDPHDDVNGACEQTPEAQRRATLVSLKTDFATTMELVGAVLQANINQKAAPLQVRRLTNEIESKEGFIRLVRSLTEMNGGL